MASRDLSKARKTKNDEFYTQFTDIEKELKHYKKHFEGKRVLCNCDDPRVSNFLRYFVMHFDDLKLKSVTATCYKNTNPDLFTQNLEDRAIRLDYTGQFDYHQIEDFSKVPYSPLSSDGDFRNSEIVEILKQSDIVVTNPPFSLFREYVQQLVAYDKKFLIIGNKNSITYKECFNLIKENKMWLGCTSMSQDLYFSLPKEAEELFVKTKKQGSAYKIIDGKVYGRSPSVWFTNLDIKKRHEKFPFGMRLKDFPYQKYDNFDAIEVPKTMYIPMDYDGVMGVPISFLNEYNPEQFKILGISRDFAQGKSGFILNGKALYARLVIQKI